MLYEELMQFEEPRDGKEPQSPLLLRFLKEHIKHVMKKLARTKLGAFARGSPQSKNKKPQSLRLRGRNMVDLRIPKIKKEARRPKTRMSVISIWSAMTLAIPDAWGVTTSATAIPCVMGTQQQKWFQVTLPP
jgi:hypothetical protein